LSNWGVGVARKEERGKRRSTLSSFLFPRTAHHVHL
jgi:hypothetical protein